MKSIIPNIERTTSIYVRYVMGSKKVDNGLNSPPQSIRTIEFQPFVLIAKR